MTAFIYSWITGLYKYLNNNSKKILKLPTNLKEMQESLNLYKVLCEACSDKETDIIEIKDHFEVMGKKNYSLLC